LNKRIENLIKQLTLEEKVGLVAGIDFWHTLSIPRLGIPSIKVTDGPHGCRTMSETNPNETLPATSFPTAIAMAATWNPDLIGRVGRALGKEARARGCAVLLGPCVNIHRSPLGGRNFESYSEDPYLSSRMAVAYIKGVQGQGVGTSVKHFALNNSEFERMTISSEASERAIHEVYFPSFEKAVKEAGTWTVMCSYNKINGTYASENGWLLEEILKKEWGFEGMVVSDWFAVHSTVPAANNGLDLEMPGPALYFGEKLAKAVRLGEVDEKTIDEKVRRILGLMLNTRALDKKPASTGNIPVYRGHHRLARQVAEESITLLKNENNVLPLSFQKTKSIAVIGPNAAVARVQGGGSAAVVPYHAVSPLEGLKKLCKDRFNIVYEPGCLNNITTLPLHSSFLLSARGSRKRGLNGEYFANNDLTGKPVVVRIDRQFNLRWMEGTKPCPEITGEDFSIKWTGIFRPGATGRHRFGMATNGWGRIYVNNRLVCSNWGEPVNNEFFISLEVTGNIHLRSGKSYPVRIEYCRSPYDRSPMRGIRIGCDVPLPADLIERAAATAADSDAAVIFAGLSEEYESEGHDRKDMDLPANQIRLIKKVAAANPRTIVVLNNGSPLAMGKWLAGVPAVLEAWYPGQESGHAIAAVLFGDANPSGKLPDTFPRRLADNPAYANYPGSHGKVEYAEDIFVGYRHYDAENIRPLFPFGHGLSYTDFEYSNLKIRPRQAKSGQDIIISVGIRNTGTRAGKEVVQVYVRDLISIVPRPPKELKAFRKVNLLPGETRKIRFKLGREALAFFHPILKKWVVEPGEFEVCLGSSSRDIRARDSFRLTD
jgi:beta-glucosidase